MYVSQAQAPYAGVYQRQPTGLPRAEFIPQYADMSNGYQPQTGVQNNGFYGQTCKQEVCFSMFVF